MRKRGFTLLASLVAAILIVASSSTIILTYAYLTVPSSVEAPYVPIDTGSGSDSGSDQTPPPSGGSGGGSGGSGGSGGGGGGGGSGGGGGGGNGPAALCSDSLDNDNDGAIDFPNDFSCSDASDNDEILPRSQCQDAIDNDGDGTIDFGNQGTGSFDVGCSSSQDNLENQAPVISGLSNTPQNPNVNDLVTFDAIANDPDGSITSYEWNFGDGSAPVISATSSATHTYTFEGSYNVVLKITDEDGQSTTTSIQLVVSPSQNTFTSICTVNDLNAVRNSPGGMYKLDCDIDMTGVTFTPIGSTQTPFSGIFEGNGHSIINLNIALPTTNDVGLFGVVSGSISNLQLLNIQIRGKDNVGGAVGHLLSGGVISRTATTGNVIGTNYAGGLVGYSDGVIQQSDSRADVIVSVNYAGGLVGYLKDVGGPIGVERISDSYAKGKSTGANYVGGLVGNIESAKIGRTYASGLVSKSGSGGSISGNAVDGAGVGGTGLDHIGGLVGASTSATVLDSYFDISGTGQTQSSGGTGLSTSQMKTQSSYVGWDFTNVWIMASIDYPKLKWEVPLLAPIEKPKFSKNIRIVLIMHAVVLAILIVAVLVVYVRQKKREYNLQDLSSISPLSNY